MKKRGLAAVVLATRNEWSIDPYNDHGTKVSLFSVPSTYQARIWTR
jgi:hypothetical protein